VRYLLDTQVYLWYLADSRKLPAKARERIAAAEEVYVSAVSVWEAAIKIGIGKLEADIGLVAAGIAASGFRELPISARHAAAVAMLPPHHSDPFDRLLVAQAMHEPLHLFTSDSQLAPYTDLVVPVI
jgi:PIN domain nuclease of toxin-antitoxin system